MSKIVYVKWLRNKKCYQASGNNHIPLGDFETREDVEKEAKVKNWELIYTDQFGYHLEKMKMMEEAKRWHLTDEDVKIS